MGRNSAPTRPVPGQKTIFSMFTPAALEKKRMKEIDGYLADDCRLLKEALHAKHERLVWECFHIKDLATVPLMLSVWQSGYHAILTECAEDEDRVRSEILHDLRTVTKDDWSGLSLLR